MKKQFIVALHFAYWLCYVLLLAVILMLVFMQIAFKGKGLSPQHIMFIELFCVMTCLPAVLSFYGAYAMLMPRFLARKKFLRLGIAGFGMVMFISLLTALLIALFWGQHFVFVGTMKGVLEQMVLPALLACIHGVLGLVLSGFVKWFDENRTKTALLEKNFQMELALIKAQLDPHFLFNTLNNIDILIEKDSVRASAYLNKLSDIMRFMLYETKAATIPLPSELAYIEKYIDLQKIRTANPDFVRFEVVGNAVAWNIAPMLFMPFIENAFKFAEHKKTGTAISISFHLRAEQCQFECSNAYTDNISALEGQSGLGSNLIRRRLALLYPKAHELSISTENNIYRVRLMLGLIP